MYDYLLFNNTINNCCAIKVLFRFTIEFEMKIPKALTLLKRINDIVV